jgi:hypothetical protein
VNTAMNLWVPERKDDFLTGCYSVKFTRIGKSCTVIKDLLDTDSDSRLTFLHILDVKKMFLI